MKIILQDIFTLARAPSVFVEARLAPVFMALLLLLGACSSSGTGLDPDDDGGIVGTGITIRGTASENRQFASIEIDARAQSGNRSSGQIAADGQFNVPTARIDNTWLLRSDLGNNEYRFGIAFNEKVAHVHSYTDAALRNWFLLEHSVQDLNTLFESDNSDLAYPTEAEYTANALQLLAYVEQALVPYQLQPNDILNRSFRADDTGIDEFLDNNPVVLGSDTIAILLTDPTSQTQSVNQSGLILSQRLDPVDLEVPSIPVGLRAIGSASNQIILIWTPATDNTAVVAYEVYRDNQLLATTAYPVYTDNGVMADTNYQYEVVAIDLIGNKSARSNFAVGVPLLGSQGVMPPTAPFNLTQQLAIPSRVELSWSQNPIAGVVAFNVYRGDNGAEPSFLLRVSGNALIDATVTGGTNYTYRISAVGANGTESALSESIDVLTTGIVIVTPVNNSNVPPLAGLTIPDTDALNCSATFTDYQITTASRIAAGCYQVEQDILVQNFGVLILDPGVVLKFSAGTAVRVSSGGAIEFLGLAANPVVLTGAQAQPGFWNGVHLDRSDSPRNKIINTVIEYTGGESTTQAQEGAINTQAFADDPTRLAMDNTLIRFGDQFGFIFLGQDTLISSFSGNLITQNRFAGSVSVGTIESLGDGSDFTGNDESIIGMPRLSVDYDIRIPDLGVPIETNGINQESGTIIIDAGVELRFEAGAVFRIRDQLKLDGTPDQPVLINSYITTPGDWRGIHLIEGANVEFNNAIIEHAGEVSEDDIVAGANPFGAVVYANDARLSFTNVTLRESIGHGLHISGDAVEIDKFDRVRLSDNAIPARIGLSHLNVFSSNLTINGNVDNRVAVEAGTAGGDVTWHDIGVDYRIDGLYQFTGGNLAINPGVSIAAAAGSELQIGGSATLQAIGTSESPIIMTGEQAGQGQWAGLTVQSNQANALNNVRIQNAGGVSLLSNDANQNGAVKVNCSAAAPAQLSLSNTRIEDSGSWGLFVSESGCDVSIGNGVQYFGNALGESNR